MRLAIVVPAIVLLTTSATVTTAQPFLDCSDASPIVCGETQTNSTPPGEPGAGNVTYYCGGDTTGTTLTYEDAWEFVYEFTSDGGTATFLMTYEHVSGPPGPGSNDLDMSIYSPCDELEGCLGLYSVGETGIEEITADLAAGTYYIVVDGWQGRQDGSPHTLTLTCGTTSVSDPTAAATTWGAIKSSFK